MKPGWGVSQIVIYYQCNSAILLQVIYFLMLLLKYAYILFRISNQIEVIRPQQTKRDFSFTSGSLSCDLPLGHKDKQLVNGSICKLSDNQNGTISCCSVYVVLCNFCCSCRLPKIHQTLWGWRLRIYEFPEETFLTRAIQVTGVLSKIGDYTLFYPYLNPMQLFV